MRITERDRNAMLTLARYHLLNRRLMQQLCYPSDRTGRGTRRRLEMMCDKQFIRRHTMVVASATDPTPAPVYVLAQRGCEHLATAFEDDRFLRKPTKFPHASHLFHHLALSELHIHFDQSMRQQQDVRLVRWINEFDVVNDGESDSKKHFRLHTVFEGDTRITCSPDAAFMLDHDGTREVFYVEVERGSTGSKELVRRKAPGYWRLAEEKLHKRHFPLATADDFRVLLLAATPRHRDTIRSAFDEAAAEHRVERWRFASTSELTPQTWLSGEMFFSSDDPQPVSLFELCTERSRGEVSVDIERTSK